MDKEHGTSTAMSIVTLCKGMIGCGIFSLPVALKKGSVVLGLVSLVFTGFVAAISFYMIGYACAQWKVTNFRDAWARTVASGSRFSGALDWTIFVNGCFSLVTYCIIMADFFSKSLAGLLGAQHPLAFGRLTCIMLVAACVLVPICLTPDLRGLQKTSAVGLAALGYAVVLILVDACMSPPASAAGLSFAEPTWGIFESIALFSHAYVSHYNGPKLYSGLRRRSLDEWSKVVGASYVIAVVSYIVFSLAGLRRFGAAVDGNLMGMYPPTRAVMFAWMSLGLSTAMTYPLIFNCWRDSCVGVVCRVAGMTDDQLSEESAARLHRLVTFVAVPISAVVGGCMSDLGVINALAGSVAGSLIAYVFPAAMFYQAVKDQGGAHLHIGASKRKLLKACAVAVGLTGVVFCIVGTVVVLSGN